MNFIDMYHLNRRDECLYNSNFAFVNLKGRTYEDLDMTRSDWSGAKLNKCCFTSCRMSQSDYSHATIKDCQFESTDMGHSNFTNACLERLDLTDMCLVSGMFTKTIFRNVSLRNAHLDGACFSWVDFGDGCLTEDSIHSYALHSQSHSMRRGSAFHSEIHICTHSISTIDIELAKTIRQAYFTFCVFKDRDFSRTDISKTCFKNCVFINCKLPQETSAIFADCRTITSAEYADMQRLPKPLKGDNYVLTHCFTA